MVRMTAGCPGWKSMRNKNPAASRNMNIATYAMGEKR
jgi:hypothetical protein